MTPKEKARELVDKFYQTTPHETWINEPLGEFMETYTAWGQAKQCALIAVDEIINNFGLFSEGKKHYCSYNTIEYYKQVKIEIENLP